MRKTDIEKAEEFYRKGEKCEEFGPRDYDVLPLSKQIKAICYFEKTVELNPNHYEAWSKLTYYYESYALEKSDIDFFKKALDASEQAIKFEAENYNPWRSRGLLLKGLIESLDPHTRIRKFLKPLTEKLYPDVKNLKEELLECYDRSVKAAREWDRPTILSLKAYLLADLERYEEAIETRRRIIEIEPNDRDSYFHLYTLYNGLNNFEKALENLEESEKHEELFASHRIRKAELLGLTGRNDEALNLYQEILKGIEKKIEADPEYLWNYVEKERILKNLGRFDELLKLYIQIIQVIERQEPTDEYKLAQWRKYLEKAEVLKEKLENS